MSNRHLARAVVLQSLYEWDFNDTHPIENFSDMIARNSLDFAPGVGQQAYMEKLTVGIAAKKADLDQIIEKAAPEWPIDKISIIDRNVLRVGLYELLFSDRKEVPPKVAINEAIELAKTFGGDTSGKFVNGVLGAVYKEIGEPGKDEVSKGKIDLQSLPVEKLGGAVVFSIKKDTGEVFLALVHDVFGRWTLSKGHLEEGDKDEDGTARKVKEELGIDIKVLENIGEHEYIASNPETGKRRKHVTYFLAQAEYKELNLEEKGGLDDARWFKLKDIVDLNFYDDILPIVTKAVNLIVEKYAA
ncbi:MAG TPA: transcription antitermination factor NusB [Candidatus Paceibacterota bacterium]|nr:transcription antitermination factor NusB [Candidatus Paceibacterota bacterium]